MQAHTPPGSYICTTLHTHAHSPAHPLHILTHTIVTPTHSHPSRYIGTTCAHPYTHSQISTNINSLQLSNTYLQISANIHICIHLQISANIQSHTTVPINCTNAVNCPKVFKIHSLSITIYTFFFFFFFNTRIEGIQTIQMLGAPSNKDQGT